MAVREYRPQTRAPSAPGAPEASLERMSDNSGGRALGGAIEDFGHVLERAKQKREANDARVAMTEGLGTLQQELADDQDFGTMGERYGTRLKELEAGIMEGVTSPKVKQALELELARGRVAFEANVIRRSQELEGSHVRASIMRSRRASVDTVVAGTPEEALAAAERHDAMLADAVAAGWMTAEEAEAERQGFEGEASQTMALEAINQDPAAAVVALSDPETAFGLAEPDRQRFLATATRAAEAEASSTATKLEAKVNTARRVLVTGGTVDPQELAELEAAVAGTEFAAELDAAVRANQRLGGFATATPAAQLAEIERVRAQGIGLEDASIDQAQLATLEAIYRDTTQDLDARISAAGRILVTGGTVPEAELAQLRADAEGTPEAANLLADAEAAAAELARHPDLTPAEQAAYIEERTGLGVRLGLAATDQAEIAALEEIHRNTVKEITEDSVGYAIKQGLYDAEPLDVQDPESVEKRLALVARLEEDYGADGRILSDAEQDAYKTAATEGTPEQQLAFVVSTIHNLGAASERLFGEIDGLDPVVRQAGLVTLETGSDEVAGILLRGRKAVADGFEMTPNAEDAIDQFDTLIAGALQGAGIPLRRGEVIASIRAYYADQAPGRVTAMDASASIDLIGEAVQRVMGGQRINGRLFGGIQSVNGVPVKLPPTMDRRSVERLVDTADPQHWRDGSLSGNLPHVGDQPLEEPGEVVLLWAGGTNYRVGRQTNRGGTEWFMDPANTVNGYFYVDLAKLGARYVARPPEVSDDRPLYGTMGGPQVPRQ